MVGGFALIGEFGAASVTDENTGLHINRETILVLTNDPPFPIDPNESRRRQITQPQQDFAAGFHQTRRTKLRQIIESEVRADVVTFCNTFFFLTNDAQTLRHASFAE